MTADLDFGGLLVRGGLRSAGVVLLRPEGLAPEEAAHRVDAALAAHGARLAGHLLVVDHARDHLRRLAPAPEAP